MSESSKIAPLITAGVLAGGRSRRMGGDDKGLIQLGNRPMIEYALKTLATQTTRIMINANRNLERYREFGWPVVQDMVGDFSGPLAGMASVMEQASTPYVLMVPCDSPLLPHDLALRLYQGLVQAGAEIAVAHDGERIQPVFVLLQRSLLPSMQHYLEDGGRKIDHWYATHRLINVDFSDNPEAFINVNTLEECELLEQQLTVAAYRTNP